MKRYLAIGAMVVVLLAAGWGGAWWFGRGELQRSLDEGVARLEEQGWTVAWDSRRIGGFPFGYTVRLTGLTATAGDGSMALQLPWALAESGGADRLIVQMPETFSFRMLPLVAQPTGDGTPDTIEGTGETEAMLLTFAADGTVEASARRLAWTAEQESLGSRVAQTVEGLEAASIPQPPGARYRFHAARIGADVEQADTSGQATTAVVDIRDVAVEGSSTLGSPEDLNEMIYAGAPGQADGALRTGPVEVRMVGPEGSAGALDWRADSSSGTAVLSSGRMELDGETRGNVWTLKSADPAFPLGGEVSVGLASAAYAMPMAPSARPDEMAFRLALQEVTAGETAWALIDPQGALPRDPATLLVDVTGTARVTKRIDTLTPGAAPPFEVSSVVVRDVSVEALGATARAAGEVEILQPIGVPLGEIQVGMTGLQRLVRALGQAGVLSPDMVMTAEAIMAVYMRPAEGEDVWQTQISFTREGYLINGLPVQ